MRSDWKELPRGDVFPQYAGYHVTLNRKGHIAINRVTHERMGMPEAVSILYDEANHRVGLKPTYRAQKNAYPVHKANRTGGRIVKAYRLLAEYGIELPETLEFRGVEIDQDSILILDLRTARSSTRAIAWQKRRTKR